MCARRQYFPGDEFEGLNVGAGGQRAGEMQREADRRRAWERCREKLRGTETERQ